MTASPALTLVTSQRGAGLFMTPDLALVTYTRGAGIFTPLLTMLIHSASHGAGSCRALWAAFSRGSDDSFTLVTKQRLTLSCETLGDPISTHTLGTPAQMPVLPILKHTAFIGTGFSRAHTDWAAAAVRGEFQLAVSTGQRWARLGGAPYFPVGARAHAARGRGPLCSMLMDFVFMMARSRRSQHTLRAALVGGNLKHFSLLKSTPRVSANGGFADNDVTMATAVLA